MNKQKGLTLIEIMISLVIGSVVLGGGIQILSASKQNYRLIESLSRMQEDARYIMETMSFDLRMTGYQVCGETSGKANLVTGASSNWHLDVFGSTLLGYEDGAGVSGLPATGEGSLVANTDAVSFKSVGLQDAYYVTSHNPNTAVIGLNKTSDFVSGQLAVICDVDQTSVFQISTDTGASDALVHDTGGSESPGNCSKFLGVGCDGTATSYEFKDDAQVFHIDSLMYYIGLGVDGSTPGLYKAVVQPSGSSAASIVPTLVAPNVVNLELEYGEDTDDDGVVDDYVDASSGPTWDNVLSVRIYLALQSKEDFLVAAGDEQTYTLNGVDMTATDRSVYRVFSTTVGLRNRLQ